MENEKINIIISGGGTGGHVFPAIAIADAVKRNFQQANILFVGSDNRLETTAVPKAGYEFIGLPIRGLQRKLSLQFFDTLFRLIKSISKAKKIVRKFNPDIVVGVGGYASAPVMYAASRRGIPTLIQEQNSFPGITNKRLARDAVAICVAYENMDKFFPAEKIFFTGNPIRNLKSTDVSKKEALDFFGLKENKNTILVTGGSLGAKSINQALMNKFDVLKNTDIQIIWQTGKRYFDDIMKLIDSQGITDNIKITKFIDRMDLAYKAADLVVARAGALTISELAILQKPAMLVPSPNVAEDHQTKNAQALVNIDAAILIKDNETNNRLVDEAIHIVQDKNTLEKLSKNIQKYAKPDADEEIVKIIKMIIEKKNVKYSLH